MRITTHLKKTDLVRFNLSNFPKQRSTYVSIFAIALLLFAVNAWQGRLSVDCGTCAWVSALVWAIGGGVAATLAGFIVCLTTILFMSSTKNGILGEHEYTISPEGLREKTSANEGFTNWEGITKVKKSGSYLLFQVSGYMFHILPARTFESVEQFQDYASASVDYWKSAQKSP